jgi:RHS repeat-associated protein
LYQFNSHHVTIFNNVITFMHNDKQHSKCAIALRATLAWGVIAISDAVGNPVVRRGYGTYGETDPAQMVGTTSAGSSAPPARRAFYGSKRSPGLFSLLRKPPPKPFGYTGRKWDPDLNLYYYRARWYDPTLGTFLQTDPIGGLDYINLYSYVGAEPGNATDPSGLGALSNARCAVGCTLGCTNFEHAPALKAGLSSNAHRAEGAFPAWDAPYFPIDHIMSKAGDAWF